MIIIVIHIFFLHFWFEWVYFLHIINILRFNIIHIQNSIASFYSNLMTRKMFDNTDHKFLYLLCSLCPYTSPKFNLLMLLLLIIRICLNPSLHPSSNQPSVGLDIQHRIKCVHPHLLLCYAIPPISHILLAIEADTNS